LTNNVVGNLGKEDREVTTPRMLALSCCALVAGCTFFAPWTEELHKNPNPFATPFQSRAELLEHIPIGASIEKVKTEMSAHGFAEWSCQRQAEQVTLIFHLIDLGGLREDRFITIHCQKGAVVDIQGDPSKPESPK
jgi:hypothetical protein